MNCDGSSKVSRGARQVAAPTRAPASGEKGEEKGLCCGHPVKMHGADGPCWVVANPAGKADLQAPWRKLPTGWRRCRCQNVQRAKPENEIGDADDLDGTEVSTIDDEDEETFLDS